MTDRIKMRVVNRYRGVEAQAGGAVEAGTIIWVTPERSRRLIADGNAVPITGPSQTAEDKATTLGNADATAGGAALSSSSRAGPASAKTTAGQQRAARKRTAG